MKHRISFEWKFSHFPNKWVIFANNIPLNLNTETHICPEPLSQETTKERHPRDSRKNQSTNFLCCFSSGELPMPSQQAMRGGQGEQEQVPVLPPAKVPQARHEPGR